MVIGSGSGGIYSVLLMNNSSLHCSCTRDTLSPYCIIFVDVLCKLTRNESEHFLFLRLEVSGFF